MKILFATHNKSKLKLYKTGLEEHNIEVLSLDDLNINIEVDETGSKPLENAYIKAKEYAKISNMITIAVDDGLLFDNVPLKQQPGVNVRRINGESKTDEELIKHYINIVNIYGENGKLKGKWIKSLAIAIDNNIFTYNFNVEKIFTNETSNKRNIGYPLDSITLDPKFNKYTVDLTDEENKQIKEDIYCGVFKFVLETLKENG